MSVSRASLEDAGRRLKDNMRPEAISNEVTGGKRNLFSPDGNAWIYRLDMEERSGRGYPVLFQRDADKGSGLGESNIYASRNYEYSFSPDSDFPAYRMDYKYYEKEKLFFSEPVTVKNPSAQSFRRNTVQNPVSLRTGEARKNHCMH